MSEIENVIRTWTYRDCPTFAENVKMFLRAYDIHNDAWGTITNITRRKYDKEESICIEFKYDDDETLIFPIKDKVNEYLQIIEDDEPWIDEGYFSDIFLTMHQMKQCVSMIWPTEFKTGGMCLTYMMHIDIGHALYKFYPKSSEELKEWEYIVTLSRKDISKLIEDPNKIMDTMFDSICGTGMAPWDINKER